MLVWWIRGRVREKKMLTLENTEFWMRKWFMKKRESDRQKYGNPWVKVAVLFVWSPLFQQDQINKPDKERKWWMEAFAEMVLRFLTAGDGGGLDSKVAWTECAFIVVCVDSESNFTRHGIKCEEERKLPPDAKKVWHLWLLCYNCSVWVSWIVRHGNFVAAGNTLVWGPILTIN